MSDTPPTEPPPVEKPKQWRGWLKEYAVIVIGVLTALAAQQAAEWLHWRGQVTEARSLIASELAHNLRQSIFRLRTEKCGERRLDELGVILDGASRTGVLPPLGDIGSMPRGIWQSGAWESAVASQAAVHFPRQELATLNAIYQFVRRADALGAEEKAHWNSLYAMVGPGRRLDPASEARLRDAMSQARSWNREMATVGANIINRVKTLNLPFSASDLDSIALSEREPLVKSRKEYSPTGQVCAPIEASPAVYGQAMSGYVPNSTDRDLRNLPKFGDVAR